MLLLDRALTSMVAQTACDRMEVIVIDNDSTDGTQELLRNWQARNQIQLTYDLEPKHGHYAEARNRGISHAQGSIVAFIDDDAYAAPDWAAQILQIFAEQPDIDCLGGPVEPDWEKPSIPKWANKELLFSMGVGDFGSNSTFLTKGKNPIGANMAFRAELLKELGGFDPRLGRVGNDSLYYDEVELIERLRDHGKRIYYDPNVIVKHYVPTSRTTKEYVLKRRRADGRSVAVWESLRGGRVLLFRNLPLRILLAVVRDIPGYLLSAMIRSDRHFTYKCRLAKTAGYIPRAVKIVFSSNSNPDGEAPC